MDKKKTRAEIAVERFLHENNINCIYEQPVSIIEDNDRIRTWYPDFYLPDVGIYLEVCGAQRDKEYDFRREAYKKNRLPVVFIEHYKDESKWKHYLMKELEDIQTYRINALQKVPYIKKLQKSEGKQVRITKQKYCHNCGNKLLKAPNFYNQCGTKMR